MSEAYRKFLERKVCQASEYGFHVELGDINPRLRPHCRPIVQWLLRGGRRGLFASFGLHKTTIQLEAVRLASEHVGGRGLIVLPLGVRQEFRRDATEILGWPEPPKFIRSIDEAGATGVYLTNYETVRDGKLDPRLFAAASLDEAAVLRGFGGTKTFREFMRLFAGDGKTLNKRVRSEGVRYRFVATATPSPNDYIELLSYAAYLDIMDVSAAKTRFFKRNSEKADQLTIHPHKETEFWMWVASWALFITKPSDLGAEYSDDGYELPPLDVRWHEVASDHSGAGTERDGQGRLFRNAAVGVTDAAREKRDSLPARIEKMMEIRAEDLRGAKHDVIFKLFRDYNLVNVYDFEQHVRLGETLEASGRLPVTFMLLQPPSWHPDVWTDVTRMLTLNSAQSAKGKEMHLCPMQFDLADRAIEQWSMPGELVFDPFAGLGTVPYRAVLKRRRGLGCELSIPYWLDSAAYCKAAELQMAMPDLFAAIAADDEAAA